MRALVVLGIVLLTPLRALASVSTERKVKRRICCAVYTVITHDYDYPADLPTPCSCSFYLYHDDKTPGPPEPWIDRRRELPENFTDVSPKLQASAWKLRRPDDLDECPRTIFIDSNVQVIRDPSPLLNVCKSDVCMFSLGRNISEEISWLVDNGHANETGVSRLQTEYRPHLAEPTWYSKVIVRTYSDHKSSTRLRCFEAHWLDALASSSVERDQVHINAALAACGIQIQELRATSGQLQSMDAMGRTIQPAFVDLNFASYFTSSGTHKAARAHTGEEESAAGSSSVAGCPCPEMKPHAHGKLDLGDPFVAPADLAPHMERPCNFGGYFSDRDEAKKNCSSYYYIIDKATDSDTKKMIPCMERPQPNWQGKYGCKPDWDSTFQCPHASSQTEPSRRLLLGTELQGVDRRLLQPARKRRSRILRRRAAARRREAERAIAAQHALSPD